MRRSTVRLVCLLVLVFGVALPTWVFGQDEPISDMEMADDQIDKEFEWLQEEASAVFVVTASRVKENIKKSAASISVITEEDIRNMGARNLMDVLKNVPGMSYLYTSDGAYKIDSRGTSKGSGQDVLIMINSHPINSNFTGGAIWTHDQLIVDNIKRIEVIRGPGSAMYGANAFSGVINVFTKEGADIDGFELSAKMGSFNTQQYNLMAGKEYEDFEYAFNINYYRTNGFESFFSADYQTYLDSVFHTQASEAPGKSQADDEKLDASFTLSYKDLKLDGRYVDRDRKAPLTPLYLINSTDNNYDEMTDYYLNLTYEREIMDGLNLFGKVYYNHNHMYSHYLMMSEGAGIYTPDGPVLLQNSLYATPSNKNDRTGAELQATYKVSDTNTLVAGGTYERMEQYDVKYSANFMYTPYEGVVILLPQVMDLSEDYNFNKDESREFKAFFANDLWDILPYLRLTVGFRYDDYSDFGNSLNPRVGLIWEFMKHCDLKLLYGRAFRAPSFQELYTQNNPSQRGNENLDPETIDTYEISIGADIPDYNLHGRITGFHNTINDSIGLYIASSAAGGQYQNRDKLRSKGVEVELKYNLDKKDNYIGANYTFQDAENVDTGETLWYIPRHKGNLMFNYLISDKLNVHANYHFQMDFERQPGDNRENNNDVETMDVTLIAKNFLESYSGLELRASLYNLFDKRNTYPTPMGTLLDDQEMPGRSVIFEFKYSF